MNNMYAPAKERSFLTGLPQPPAAAEHPCACWCEDTPPEDCHLTNDMIAKILGGDLS